MLEITPLHSSMRFRDRVNDSMGDGAEYSPALFDACGEHGTISFDEDIRVLARHLG